MDVDGHLWKSSHWGGDHFVPRNNSGWESRASWLRDDDDLLDTWRLLHSEKDLRKEVFVGEDDFGTGINKLALELIWKTRRVK